MLIDVQYDELPAIFDPDAAMAPGAPILHEHPEDYVFRGDARMPVPHLNVQGRLLVQKGEPDIEAVFASCSRVFEYVFETPRQHGGYIEPHACVVWIDEDGLVQVVTANKMPFDLRDEMALVTGEPRERIVVDCGFVGGDFGGKGFSIDDFTCYYLARATGRPVKAVTAYTDDMQTSTTRHATTTRLRTGLSDDHRMVAHESIIIYNGGAYAAPKPTDDLVLYSGVRHFSAYNIPHSRLELLSVYTNALPAGHLRGPGNQQVVFGWESHVDMMARDLGIDPLEFRELNVLRPGQAGMAGQKIHAPRGVEVLQRVREITSWGAAPLSPDRGRGLAFFTRETGAGKGGVRFRLLESGQIEVVTGVPDQGSGAYAMIQRVAAAELSISPSSIVVTRETTATALRDPGPSGTRSTHVIGQATLHGATRFKELLESLASELLGWPTGGTQLIDGHFVNPDQPGQAADFEDIARRLALGLPVALDHEYDSAVDCTVDGNALNFSALIVDVEVDQGTGRVTVHNAITVTDVGAVLNPIAHEGQIDGGFVFGLGATLAEEMLLEDGRVTNPSLAEYKIPTMRDAPPFRIILLPGNDGPGPFGAKAVGELSNVGVGAAIANAIHDAMGVRIMKLPISAEEVLASLR
jgi:carbon-monoxide dehydrogenase large subunit